MNNVVEAVYVTADDIDHFVPGALVFLSRQRSAEVMYQGRELPLACTTGSNLPFGVVALSQERVVQTLAPFRVYRLQVVVSGVVCSNEPADNHRPGDDFIFKKTVYLGRVVAVDPCSANGQPSRDGKGYVRLCVGPIRSFYGA